MASFDIQRLWNGKKIFWVVTVIGLIADLGSKIWAEAVIKPATWEVGQPTPVVPVIEGVFAWKWAVNFGAAFSIFDGRVFLLASVGIIALVAMIVYVYKLEATERTMLWGLGLVVSGAIGNVADRIAFGYVRDFMYFDFDLPFHESVGFIPQRYPVFNVADIAILAGAALLIVGSYRSEKAAKARAAAEAG